MQLLEAKLTATAAARVASEHLLAELEGLAEQQQQVAASLSAMSAALRSTWPTSPEPRVGTAPHGAARVGIYKMARPSRQGSTVIWPSRPDSGQREDGAVHRSSLFIDTSLQPGDSRLRAAPALQALASPDDAEHPLPAVPALDASDGPGPRTESHLSLGDNAFSVGSSWLAPSGNVQGFHPVCSGGRSQARAATVAAGQDIPRITSPSEQLPLPRFQ